MLRRFGSRFSGAVLTVLAVAFLPVSAPAQTADSDQYQLRKLAGLGLFNRGYPAEGFFILEELGDAALAAGDTAGAIEAYHDAAWIAGDVARTSAAPFTPAVLGYGLGQRGRTAAGEFERVLGKAQALGGSDQAVVTPLRLDRDLNDRAVGLEVARILSALERPLLAVTVYEIIGDDALEEGDAEFAERAYIEGAAVASEVAMERSLSYQPTLMFSESDFQMISERAQRLEQKAVSAAP